MVPDYGAGLAMLIMIVVGTLVLANLLFPLIAGTITGAVSSKSTAKGGAAVGLFVGGLSAVINGSIMFGDSGAAAMWFATLSIPVGTAIAVIAMLRGGSS